MVVEGASRTPIDAGPAVDAGARFVYLPGMPAHETAVTIGNFDGVHLGHVALVQRARELAGPGGRVVVLSFDPHPLAILKPEKAPALLTTFEKRAALLKEAGADEVYRLEPDAQLLGLDATQFMRHVVDSFGPRHIVEGGDFRFGRGRGGDVDALRSIGARLGFDVDVVGEVEAPLADQSLVRASSTRVRWLLERGRVGDAHHLLARPYEVGGTVTPGDRRGRTVGFPTANIEPETMLPADGVYAGLATLPDGRPVPAAINIGTRPTVDGFDRRLEAHLLGLPSSWSPERGPEQAAADAWMPIETFGEYGWRCELSFRAWLRDQVRFASLGALVDQLGRDCARALDFAESDPLLTTAGSQS